MKNKITFLTVLAALLFTVPLYAKDGKIENPEKNEVIIIGRISVKAKQDMNFYAQTRGVKDSEKENRSTYQIPFALDDSKDSDKNLLEFVKANPKLYFNDGEFFYARYKVDKKTRNLKFKSATEYYFFNSGKTFIYLPFDFNIDVPKDVQAMYVGSFYFETSGNDFIFTKINHVDEYELAQDELNKVTKKQFDLYRADLKENLEQQK